MTFDPKNPLKIKTINLNGKVLGKLKEHNLDVYFHTLTILLGEIK